MQSDDDTRAPSDTVSCTLSRQAAARFCVASVGGWKVAPAAVMDADGDEQLRASLEALTAAGIPTAVVEADFEATRPSHLSVTAGQIVEVIDRTSSSWWKVSTESGEGFVPTGCLSDVGASADALVHDIHVHMNAADEAHAEVEHHEQLQAAIEAEHGRVQAEIDQHRVHLAVAGVDHELRLPESAPAGFHYFKPPHRHTQGTVLTPGQLYDTVPHLTADTMVCRHFDARSSSPRSLLQCSHD